MSDDPISPVHRVPSRPSGRSWWGERPDWLRHLVYWSAAIGLLVLGLSDDETRVSNERPNLVPLIVLTLTALLALGYGAWAIRQDIDRLPPWRTTSRVLVLMTFVVGTASLIMVLVRADIDQCAGFGCDPATPRNLIGLFTWHAADVVPGLSIPEASHWAEPATPTDFTAGTAIVFVRLFTVGVLLASAKRLWDRFSTT